MNREVHIIGAGVSGLVAALEFARAGYQVHVYEKDLVPGGLAKTIRYEDYYVDLGPHLFHTSNPDIVAYWESLFPGEFRFPALFGGNFLDGQIFDYPLTRQSVDQMAVGVRSKVLAEWRDLQIGAENVAQSYKDYMVSVAGPTLQKMFYEDYPRKLWGIPTEELSPNWAPHRIEIREERRPFHGGQWCGVAINGCGRIAEILVQKISELGGKIHFGVSITAIETSDNEITGLWANGSRVELADSSLAISTVRIDTLTKMLGMETSLSFRSIKLITFVIDGPDPLPKDYDWLYFQDPEIIFHRVGSQTRFSKAGIRNGLSIITAEVAYSAGDQNSHLADAELVARCKADFEKVGMPLEGSLVATHVNDAGGVYPAYWIGFEETLRQTETEIAAFTNLYATGSLADYAYSDLQVLFAKSIDLVNKIVRPDFAFNNVTKSRRRTNSFSQVLTVDDIKIGKQSPPYLIAEIGLNHGGSLETAFKLIEHAVAAGFQAVKFQTFEAGRASSKVENARYNEDLFDLEESISDLFDRLVMPADFLTEVFKFASERGITAFSTPFDLASVELLERLNVPIYKISSMDLVNLPLIRAVAKTAKPIILSTGMSSMVEIEEAIAVLREEGAFDVALLHCISSYPTPPGELNLRAIGKLGEYFDLPIGFSDHSPSNSLVPAAVALGASIIEKHVTLSRRMKGPDHSFSLEPSHMNDLAQIARSTYFALGDGQKRIMPSEMESVRSLRRSIFAAQDIEVGSVIVPEMLSVKSPGIGILPKYLDLIVGRTAQQTIRKDYPIQWDSI